MQPYLFPYIGYYQLIKAVDIFVIYDDVNYIKRGYVNRNSILANGNKYYFTLELMKSSQNKLINEIEIGNNGEKILKTIRMAYKKAPFFDVVYPLLEVMFKHTEKNLSKFLEFSLISILNFLEIKTNTKMASKTEKNRALTGQEKIIDICKRLGADCYVNPMGGRELYSKTRFLEENIQLKFLSPDTLKYCQFGGAFVPNLSIIDVMMFNSKEAVKEMLKRYTLF